MKRAVFLHATDANTTENWWPWLRELLEIKGYEIFAPVLPNNHVPNKKVYENFLRESGWDFKDNLLVGHSSGATTILNLLSNDWFPKVDTVILLGTFLNEKFTKDADWYEKGQFDNLFLEKYDSSIIKNKAKRFYFVHGHDDPYCDIKDAKKLAEKLDATFITIKNGHHLGSESGINQIPRLSDQLIKDGIL